MSLMETTTSGVRRRRPDPPTREQLLALCDESRRHQTGDPISRIAEAIWYEHGVASKLGRAMDVLIREGDRLAIWLESLPPLWTRHGDPNNVSLERIHDDQPGEEPTPANAELHKHRHKCPTPRCRRKEPMPPEMLEAIKAYVAERVDWLERALPLAKVFERRNPVDVYALRKRLRRWKRLQENLNAGACHNTH